MKGCKATLSFTFCILRTYIVSQEVTVVCKELKEWVCQVVGKDHFIPLSIRQREAPILTLLMLEVVSFPNQLARESGLLERTPKLRDAFVSKRGFKNLEALCKSLIC